MSDDPKIVSLQPRLLALAMEREQFSTRMDLIGILFQIMVKAVEEMREHGADSAQIARVLQVTVEALEEDTGDE
jgi:hypothetical protein